MHRCILRCCCFLVLILMTYTLLISRSSYIFHYRSIKNINLINKCSLFDSSSSSSSSTTSSSSSTNVALDPETGIFPSANINATKPIRIKVRQHVNPLSEKFQVPLKLPSKWLIDSNVVFAKPNQRLYLDIGCAKGSWAINMAKEKPDFNFLGLEIRRPCVDLALYRKTTAGLNNVYFFASNANVDISQILHDVNVSGVGLEQVSIQFPDPLFKTKHKKRRVVTDEVVTVIRHGTPPGTKILLQSDILEVTCEMVESFLRNGGFQPADGYRMERPEDLCSNPSTSPVKTEREIATENKGQPVHRMLLLRSYS